jgi:hypothetical protein
MAPLGKKKAASPTPIKTGNIATVLKEEML